MDAVRSDQYVGVDAPGRRTGPIDEPRAHAIADRLELCKAHAGTYPIRSDPSTDRVEQDHLQLAAMNRVLWILVAGRQPARIDEDFLAEAVHEHQLFGVDRNARKRIAEAKPGQYADRMRQQIDADTESANRFDLLVHGYVEPATMQTEGGSEAADTGARDDDVHATILNKMSETIWKKPISTTSINRLHENTAVSHLGIEFIEVGANTMVARMPVDERTRQPYGLLHGGALALLAETLGSCAGISAVPPGELAVGVEVNANHVRSARSGFVTGTCRPVHLGRSIHVWQVDIVDDEKRLCCVSRMTLSVVPDPTARA